MPLSQECWEQQGGLCAAPGPVPVPPAWPSPTPAPHFPPCFFLVLFGSGGCARMCPVSTSGCKELNSYQLLERRKQELLFTEKSAASPPAAPSPSLPALHDSNFRAEASSRPALLFTPGWTQHPSVGCDTVPGWVLGSRGTNPATVPWQEITTLIAAAGQPKRLKSHGEEASPVQSKACSDSAVSCPCLLGIDTELA